MEKEYKYYMNNPCKIVRAIGDSMCEIIVSPRFTDGVDSESGCFACLGVAGAGAHPGHTCGYMQDFIDHIDDECPEIFMIAENRHIHDEPLEAGPIKKLRENLEELKLQISDASGEALEKKTDNSKLAARREELNNSIRDIARTRDSLVEDVGLLIDKVRALKNQATEGQKHLSLLMNGKRININEAELLELIKKAELFDRLDGSGIDKGFEWGDAIDPIGADPVDDVATARLIALKN